MSSDAARYAGLVLAPVVWAISTQFGQILPYADCAGGTLWTLVATWGAVLFSTAGAVIPLRGRALTVSRMKLFISGLSASVGFAFAFAVLLQGAATLLLSTCER